MSGFGLPRATGSLIDNRYEVQAFLGASNYGEVYRVRDRHLNAAFVLKLLRGVLSANPWAEAQILMALKSPYVLEVENAGTETGVRYLVTELAANGSAEVPMHPIGVPPEQAVRWIRHACRGAARTHAARLVHRDIKPHNVFLTSGNEAQLGDFGIAARMDANGEAAPHGTPITLAPEVAAGANTSVLSDIYSLGATLYALLSGEYPDPRGGGPPLRDLAPHVTQALAQRVHRAISPSAADRYQTASEFDAALGNLPAALRQWRRTDEHVGHDCCFRGEAKGKSEATVCLVPVGKRWEVLGVHQPLGRRITAACRPPAPESAIARNLRAAMAAVP